MKILKDAGFYRILAQWPSEATNTQPLMVLEQAGRTCYQSEKGDITPESSAKFITNIMKRGHYSVIEHGWRGYIITSIQPERILLHFWPEAKFMSVTWRGPSEVLVSANLETWRKLYIASKLDMLPGILQDLETWAPQIFDRGWSKMSMQFAYSNRGLTTPILTYQQLVTEEEQLTHIAYTTQYNNHSRGFTHELVRHRVPVFSQESTRYVDESDFEVVVPPHKDENESIGFRMGTAFCEHTPAKLFSVIEEMYKTLRGMGWKPEDARQVLPTAIKAQIVMSCNLLEYRYIFFRRCAKAAHWEIRRTMCDQLTALKLDWPHLFADFTYDEATTSFNVPDCTHLTHLSSPFVEVTAIKAITVASE